MCGCVDVWMNIESRPCLLRDHDRVLWVLMGEVRNTRWAYDIPLLTLLCYHGLQVQEAENYQSILKLISPALDDAVFRTLRNYQSIEYLGPRMFDKIIFALIMLALYW